MKEYPKFDKDSKCVKCGFGTATFCYTEGWRLKIPSKPDDNPPDTIEKTCQRCGYKWRELTLDEKA